MRQATAGIFWRQVTQWRACLGLLGLFGLAQALLWAIMPQAPWPLHVGLGALLLATALSLAVFASRYYQGLALRNFERFHGRPVQVSLDEDAYRYSAGWGQGSIEWSRFDSLWRFPTVWVLLQHSRGGVSVLLPSRDLSPEARDLIEHQVGPGRTRVQA